jgi:hypothetical protein
MKIEFDKIDKTQFLVIPKLWNGIKLNLVVPRHDGCEWNKDNLIFRSSVWDCDGNLVSASFKKFFNLGEREDLFPRPTSLDGFSCVEKIDGSTLIASKIAGKWMLRTRGSIDASDMPNGNEINEFSSEIVPKLEKIAADFFDDNHSFLFEWMSSKNRIIIKHEGKPKFTLIGIINHHDYSLVNQFTLDSLAGKYDLLRPARYTFDSNFDSAINKVVEWDDREGICAYADGDQVIYKVKSKWYLLLHEMKSRMSSIRNVLNMWFERGKPAFDEFYKIIETELDYEVAEMNRDRINLVCSAYSRATQDINKYINKMFEYKKQPRKYAAQIINAEAKNEIEKALCFAALDEKNPMDSDYFARKVMNHYIELMQNS